MNFLAVGSVKVLNDLEVDELLKINQMDGWVHEGKRFPFTHLG